MEQELLVSPHSRGHPVAQSSTRAGDAPAGTGKLPAQELRMDGFGCWGSGGAREGLTAGYLGFP